MKQEDLSAAYRTCAHKCRKGRLRITIYDSLFTIHMPSCLSPRPRVTSSRSPSASCHPLVRGLMAPPVPIHHSPFTFHGSLFTVHCSPFPVHS